MQYAVLILIVLVQGIRCQNCTRTNSKKGFCVTSCNITQSNCSGNSACVCDGDCGYSCVERDHHCPGLRNIVHGRVRHKDAIFGSIARYKCSEPYTLQGSRRRKCRGNGKWDGSEPVCKIICEDPGNIQNGTRDHKGFERGKRVKYRCSPGFTMQGRGTLTCRRTGQWDRQKPTCTCVRTNTKHWRYCQSACDPKRNTCKGNKECICDGDCGYSCVPKGLSCGRPSGIQNGKRQYSSTRFLSTAKYQCNKPYSLLGPSLRTCRGIREWDGPEPECKILCQEPKDTEHANKQIFRSNYDENYVTAGDRVVYNCFPGYKMEGAKILTCDERGEWDNPKPNCTLPSCGPPEVPANAELWKSTKDKASYRYNERVMFRCKTGYFSRGIGVRTCGISGWSGPAFACSPKSCGDPGIPPNGEIKSYIFTFKSRVYFDCNHGYKLVGDKYRQCQSNQRWSGRMPTCQEIDCGLLPTPVMATKVLETNTKVDGVVKFACNEKGYEISGSEVRTCLSTGLWSGFTTSCKIKSCGDPGTPVNGKQVNVKNNYNYGGTVEFACSDNYTLAGSSKIECEESKDWSASVPRCFAPCSDPGIPNNGSRIGENFLHGSSLNFTCHQGFDLEGDGSIMCTDGGWSGTQPQCKVVSCGDPGTPQHGYKKTVSGNYTYRGFVRFKCDNNYTLEGRKKLTCQANKKWNNELPKCLAPCRNPGHLVHGRTIGDNIQHGSVVRFECLDDYVLHGSAAMSCDDGVWTPTKPTCAQACDGGLPLGMITGAIPDNSFSASSETDEHPAHHGRLGGNRYWCSKNEKLSELRIDLPKKYKITAATIEVRDTSVIGVIGLGGRISHKWYEFYAEKPVFKSRRSNISVTKPFIAGSIQILVQRPRRVTDSVCIRAEVYGCEIPGDCIMVGSPVFASYDGQYLKGNAAAIDVKKDKFELLGSGVGKLVSRENTILNTKPDPLELTTGTIILAQVSLPDEVKKGEIMQVIDQLYSVKFEDGNIRNIKLKAILVVVIQSKFC